MAESAKNLVPKFFDETGTTYDDVVSYGTLGKDKYWKRKILEQISDGSSFLDLACGTGILTREIAKKFPNSKIVGIDITKSYLDVAKENSSHFDNISFTLDDAEEFKLDSRFDCITASYLPKYCDPEILVKNCTTHLKPGGKIIFHDFTYPKNLVVRGLWNFFLTFSAVGGMFHSKLERRTNRATKANSKNQMAGKLFRCNEEKWIGYYPTISHMRCVCHPNWHKIIMI